MTYDSMLASATLELKKSCISLQLSGWYLVQTPPLITGYHCCQNDVTNKKQEFATETFTYLRLELKIAPSLPSIEPNMVSNQFLFYLVILFNPSTQWTFSTKLGFHLLAVVFSIFFIRSKN